MTPFVLIVSSLAVWRLSYGIVHENGPLMVWARLRAYLASSQKRSGGLFDMVSCVRCLSIWISLITALFVSDSFLALLIHTFAISGTVCLIDVSFKKLNSLPIVARPATNDKVSVSRSSTPE